MPSVQRQLLPHYLAVFVLTLAALAAVRKLLGSGEIWVNLLVVVVVVLTYPTLVRFLGIEPDAWRRDSRAN